MKYALLYRSGSPAPPIIRRLMVLSNGGGEEASKQEKKKVSNINLGFSGGLHARTSDRIYVRMYYVHYVHVYPGDIQTR